MEGIKISDIAGTLRYGRYFSPNLIKAFVITFGILSAALLIPLVPCIIDLTSAATSQEVINARTGIIVIAVFIPFTVALTLGIHFYFRRQTNFVKRCLSAPDARLSAAKIYNIGDEGWRRDAIVLRFKIDGKKYEKRSKGACDLFKSYARYEKISIIYSPSLDEVLFVKIK